MENRLEKRLPFPVRNSESSGAEWDDMEKEFQFGWIEHACSIRLEDSGNTGETIVNQAANDAMVELIEVYGQWLRENVLTPKRRSHFLSLYAEDPDKAFSEVDELFTRRTQ